MYASVVSRVVSDRRAYMNKNIFVSIHYYYITYLHSLLGNKKITINYQYKMVTYKITIYRINNMPWKPYAQCSIVL